MNKDIADSNIIIEEQLIRHIEGLEKKLEADLLVLSGPIGGGAEGFIRNSIESLNDKNGKPKLVVILTTLGGFIEVVERMVDIFRHHYETVEFIIPNYAMSAGTILAMSGDAIHMDYYSLLGPIDPQVPRPGRDDMVPAIGYLIQYDRLIEKSKKGELTTAELAFLVQKFDPAELYSYEQSRDLSVTLLKDWLVRYKFKNWKRTKTRKRVVTLKMKRARALSIAKALNNPKKWHLHSRGISMEVLRKDLKLQIEDFGKDNDLRNKIRLYYGLLTDYMIKRGFQFAVQTRQGFVGFAVRGML